MPKIPTYDIPALDLRPSETGINALEQAARRTGAFYGQAGEDSTGLGNKIGSATRDALTVALQETERHEVSAGSKNFADLMANKTVEWNKIANSTDPNHLDVAAKQFREENLEPALQQFAEKGFLTEGGQKFAQSHVAAFRQHMFEKTAADVSTGVSLAAQKNYAEATNKLATTAYLDPSSIDFSLKTSQSLMESTIASHGDTMKPGDAARLRTEGLLKTQEGIVKSGVIGMIRKNPDIDLAAIQKKYSEFLKPGEMDQFQKQVQAQAKANAYYDRTAATLKKQEADLNVAKGINDVFTNSVTIDQNNPGRLLIKPDAMQKVLDTVRANPDAPSAASHARTAIDWLQHQQNEKPTQTDPATKTGLYNGMFSPDKPTSDIDIYKAEVDGKLSRTDAHSLLQLNKALTEEPLRGPIYQDTMKAAHAELVLSGVGLPGKDIAGEANYAKFVQSFIPDYLAKKRAGTLAPNALDIKDKTSLISQHMETFHRTVSQRMDDYLAVLGGTNAAAERPATGGVALPPVTERKKDQVYKTGMGDMKWTGTGWVKP